MIDGRSISNWAAEQIGKRIFAALIIGIVFGFVAGWLI